MGDQIEDLLKMLKTLQELGADETVDYTKEDFSAKYKDQPFDVIMDSIGGAALSTLHAYAGHDAFWHGL